jgi:phosphatidylinositol alpha-mannosyltransferase
VRVAITHAYCWPEVRRGAERIINEVSASLAGRGHEVTLFTAGRARGVDRPDGVRVVRLQRAFSATHRHERDFGIRLVPRLAARRFDVVHSLGPRDAVAGLRARSLRGHRTVYWNMGVPERAWWDSIPEGSAHDRIVRDVDVYACMSRYALDFLERDYGRTGTLLPGGVDLERFTRGVARDERPTLLFSGALSEPRKGAAVLLRAVPLIARAVPDVRVWLSGPGDADALLAAAPPTAVDHVEVLDLGDPQQQADRYARAWATVLPSENEVFGLVLLESLACGTPLVGADNAAIPELCRPGVGVLSRLGDHESLAAACVEALELSQRSGIEDACRAVAAPYDWRTGIAPLLEKVYAGD